MALEWNPDNTDIENVKNMMQEKIESHGVSPTLLSNRLDILKDEDQYDDLFQEHKYLIYEYTDGMNTLEAMKDDFPALTDDVDNAIKDIEKTDEEILKKEVIADYNNDVKSKKLKSDTELNQYLEMYKEHYQIYHDAMTEKDKILDIRIQSSKRVGQSHKRKTKKNDIEL